MPSEWAYEIAREQRRDVETMAANLDAARAQGRRDVLEAISGRSQVPVAMNSECLDSQSVARSEQIRK